MNKMLNNTSSSKAQRKRRARAKKKLVKQIIKGAGDYTFENTISDPAKRLEAKIDHLEKSLNKKATVNSAASSIGRTLGSLVGQGDLGALAGGSIAKFFGHGDYTVKSNSLMQSMTQAGNNPPKFSSAKRSIRVVEREFIGDITGSTAFTNLAYAITPTNSQLFPWLSILASQYDQWEPHGIIFEFVPTSASWSGSGQNLGAVIMATDYDVLDKPFISKIEMENSDYACSTKPDDHLAHGIECDPSERPTKIYYTSSPTTASDARFSVLGNFQVATVGQTSTPTLGELWVSYDISFYKKQLPTLGSFYATCNLHPLLAIAPGSAIFSDISTVNGAGYTYLLNGFTTQIVGSDSRLIFSNARPGYYILLYWMSVWENGYVAPAGTGVVQTSNSLCPSPGVGNAARSFTTTFYHNGNNTNYITFKTPVTYAMNYQLAITPWDSNAAPGF